MCDEVSDVTNANNIDSVGECLWSNIADIVAIIEARPINESEVVDMTKFTSKLPDFTSLPPR